MPGDLPPPGVPRHRRTAGSVGRSAVRAVHGMVATSQPLAAQAGLAVLQRGGNAVDAAIACNAMLGVVEPMSCGIGGDLFALVWEARTQTLHGLDASGRSPYGATIKAIESRGLRELPEFGPLSWSVPGAVDGWEALRARFGTWKLGALLEPAIAAAEDGFPVSEVIAGFWSAARDALVEHAGSSRTFLPAGRAPRAGEIFRNGELARTYREISQQGRDAFYRGRIARDLVAFSARSGGLFTAEDFAETAASWVQPISTSYRGAEIVELPPPGQGLAVLQMLNLLEAWELSALGPRSAEYWHLLIEAKKLAFADRARLYADPAMARVPVEELLSKSYAAERRQRIDPLRAAIDVPAGDPRLSRGGTVYLCAVDNERNAVSLIQSNYRHFGSKMAPDGLGFALQNRGSQFALDPLHPNRLEPHKRPFSTIIPAMALRKGKPWLVFGVMGADMQPQGQVQALVNLLDFGMGLQAAGEAPRIEHLGSATPTGRPEAEGGGTLQIERGIPPAVFAALVGRGHRAEWASRNGGGYQAIAIDEETSALAGGSESRSDGCAVGY